ncbi:hypothetical protein B0H17DRAFT_1143798 [Mycena rosella]|uniref:Uncharacterized protein n=1 Tax=Mycena rosella TaxID=1033263 RepID=A0AAD7G431_MYCRO|nr:hypothetical protein B0H17DRAFT_1143798 [Mycena rosella]
MCRRWGLCAALERGVPHLGALGHNGGQPQFTIVRFPCQLTVQKYIKHRSAFKFTLVSARFTSAEVEVLTGNLALDAGLGPEFDLTYKYLPSKASAGGEEIPFKFSKDFPIKFKKLPTIPSVIFINGSFMVHKPGFSALAIPGILVIGPYISFNAGLELDVQLKGKALARNSISWSNVSAKLDFINEDAAIGNWIPALGTPLTRFEVEGHVAFYPFVSAAIMFGITVSGGTLNRRRRRDSSPPSC